jgi:serine/threonine protein kinase
VSYEDGIEPPAPADLAHHFPQLEVLELVGKGGMGAVYRARQPGLDRLVAVKILPPEVARDPAFAERFSREARSLARFNHPNIVTIYDFGETGGLYYIIMEFVAGNNLRQLLQAGALNEARMLGIVAQVCDALQYAHDAGVIHRDIKPENILIDGRGQVKIADFGLAKLVGLAPAHRTLTGSRDVMGTLYYMAPEQLLRNVEVDQRADIYSLGVVFYEMLTGELPVGRFAPPGQRVQVDSRLDAIVLRALESKPEHRYQDAAEIKRDVEAVLAGPVLPVAARADSPCIRFTIPDVSWMGAHVEGEIYRDATTLILDFSVVNSMYSPKPKEVRIPLADITMIALLIGYRPTVPKWLNSWLDPKPELVIKVNNPNILSELPVGKHGRGRLQIHSVDLEATQKLVDSILRDATPRAAERLPVRVSPASNPGRVRQELVAPAVGLALTAIVALVSTMVLTVVLLKQPGAQWSFLGKSLVLAEVFLFMPLGVWLLSAGAARMLRERSYTVCLAAALAATLPWSPAWLIGLPIGIWALRVLSRREVILDFLGQHDRAVPAPPIAPKPTGPLAGKLRSWWHSFAGYFVTMNGGRSKARRDGENQNRG